MSILTAVENFFKSLVTDIDTAISPAVKYLEANVPAEAITLAESILAGAVTGTPWATLTATLLSQAEAQGITLAENAAKIVLNTAQSNIIAKQETAASTVAAPSA